MSKGRRSQAAKGHQELAVGNRFSMLQEDDDQYLTPNGGRDGRGSHQRRVQAAGDGSDESNSRGDQQRRVRAAGDGSAELNSPAQGQGSNRDAVVEDDMISELGSQIRNVTVNLQVPPPKKLKKAESEVAQKVLVVQRHWQTYWDTAGREDNGAAVWDDATLTNWGARLTTKDGELLMRGELESMNGRVLFEILVDFLKDNTKTVVTSNLEELNKMKSQLKWDFQFGVDYPGWASVCASMNDKLATIATLFGDEFKTVQDDEALANAFLNTFQNARLRNAIKNRAHARGKSKNIFGLFEEARKVITEAGKEEHTSLSVGVSTLIGSILMAGPPKSPKGKSGQNGSNGAGKVPGASGAASGKSTTRTGNGGEKKCFSCGADGKGHDFKKCAKRTDHTPEEKAAGETAKAAAAPKSS